MTYVLSVVGRFSSGNSEVILKARGRAITAAVDVAEITKRRFMNTLKVEGITIGTEEVEMREGGKKQVSTMEILLKSEGKSEAKPPA